VAVADHEHLSTVIQTQDMMVVLRNHMSGLGNELIILREFIEVSLADSNNNKKTIYVVQSLN
jgi:hypothetical protein